MKKILFHLFLVTLLAPASKSLFAQNQSGSYLRYTLNGQPQSFSGDGEVSCYYTQGEKLSDDEKDFEITAGYVDILGGPAYKLTFYIRTAANTKPAVAKMPLMSSINQTEHLPNAHIKVDYQVGEDYVFYATTDLNAGNFAVTAVDGDWVEGTFDTVVPNTFDEAGAPLKITNGSFRIKLDRL